VQSAARNKRTSASPDHGNPEDARILLGFVIGIVLQDSQNTISFSTSA
jgi:hypothetical protein